MSVIGRLLSLFGLARWDDPLRHRFTKDGRVVWADGRDRRAWRV
jgi:hypothetical protein